MANADRFGALVIRELSVGGYWAKVRNFERSCLWGAEIIDAVRFVGRTAFSNIGGYDTEITGMEDFDFQVRINEAGLTIGMVEEPITHHEEGVSLSTCLRKRQYYGATDNIFREKHPEAWKKISSPKKRIFKMLRCKNGGDMAAKIWLLFGYFIMRGSEYAFRVM